MATRNLMTFIVRLSDQMMLVATMDNASGLEGSFADLAALFLEILLI
jgi:hypothetical protein